MKNFDEQRSERLSRAEDERTFVIGGEPFLVRAAVRPEATEPWEDIEPGLSHGETLANCDQTILNLIEPAGDAHERWRNLRAREDDPVTLQDMLELIPWMIGTAAGRPTEPPESSSDGRGSTGTTLTAASSSPDTPEEQAA
jgi:hypothetical protein